MNISIKVEALEEENAVLKQRLNLLVEILGDFEHTQQLDDALAIINRSFKLITIKYAHSGEANRREWYIFVANKKIGTYTTLEHALRNTLDITMRTQNECRDKNI